MGRIRGLLIAQFVVNVARNAMSGRLAQARWKQRGRVDQGKTARIVSPPFNRRLFEES